MIPHFHPLPIAEVRRETDEAVSLAFAVPAALRQAYRFAPGQYLTLRATLDGEEVRRSYSICSGLDDGDLRVAVKRVAGGRFSTFANEALRPGDVIDVMTPMGRFTTPLEPGRARHHLLVACGSGITPILSIAKSVLAREPESRVTLLYGNRTVGTILFRDALEDLKDRHLTRFSVQHVLSRESADAPIAEGRIDAEKIRRFLPLLGGAGGLDHAFLCGPQGMIEAARAALIEAGLPPERVHQELFATPESPPAPRAVPRPETTNGLPLAIRLDGALHRLAMDPTETIVEAALRQGLDLPYSCKGGMCCTCRAKLTEGEVAMDQNFSLEPWELEAGYVLTCQSRPKAGTGRVAVDFDQV